MYKAWYFIDNNYVDFDYFYSHILLRCTYPHQLYYVLHDLILYNQANFEGHLYKIKKIYRGKL